MARGQMEILGLAIIVVLIMLGVLFAVMFVLRAPASNVAQEYKESQLAASLITAMLGTTTPCNDASVTELLQDCAVLNRLECPAGDSCAQAQDAIGQMLAGTLETWKRSYQFSITGAYNVEQLTFASGDCSGERESSTNPVPTPGGALQVRLDLCR
ncbi:hypothetical protein HY492_04115 [Candidatus Woesearchaeota archaeon]|nr:hypothetical protein [Candidatus Woesearchaeota archaeon]